MEGLSGRDRTRYGDVLPLLQKSDDKFAIIDSGDEIRLQFDEAPPEPGMVRDYVLVADGYFQEITGKVGNLPFHAMSNYPYPANEKYPSDKDHLDYQKEWNTRQHLKVNGKMVEVNAAVAGKNEQPGYFFRILAGIKSFFNRLIKAVTRFFSGNRKSKTTGILKRQGQVSLTASRGLAAAYYYLPRHYSLNIDQITLEVQATGSKPNGDCEICHSVHGKNDGSGNPISKALNYTQPAACFNNNFGCHSDAANSADNISIKDKMASSDNTAKHSLDCTYCHDPHLNTRDYMFVGADNRYTNYDSLGSLRDYIGPDGSVYLMARAQHDGTPPNISGITSTVGASSATITWTTNEPADSTVEYSVYSDLSYSQSQSNSTLVTAHSVTLSPLASGTYYYRVKTADALSNLRVSGISSFTLSQPPSTPVLNSNPPITVLSIDASGSGTGRVDLSVYSGGVDPEGDPVQFAFEVRNSPSDTATSMGYSDYASSSTRSLTLPINGWSETVLYARCRARDSNMAYSAWGPWQSLTMPKGGSCPFVFVWNGKKYQYISDMAGASINLKRKYSKNFKNILPFYLNLDGLVADENNRYRVKIRAISEREAEFIDSTGLLVVDHPKGYQVIGDSGEYRGEFKQVIPRKLYTVKEPKLPLIATDKYGNDILARISAVDDNTAPVDSKNPSGPDYYTFDFGKFDTRYAKLLIDGWTHFPNNPANDQAKVLVSPQVQVMGKDGKWKKVRDIGFISGDLKTMVVDLSGSFVSKDRIIRIYVGKPWARVVIDRVRLDDSAPVPVQAALIKPAVANLHARGASNQMGDTYEHRVHSEDDVKTGELFLNYYGKFTKYGDVLPLVSGTDDMFAIMQHGDELSLEFAAPPAKPGFDRSLLLTADYYYKNPANFKDFRNVSIKLPIEPLPFHGMSSYPYNTPDKYPDDPVHKKYQAEWNTREYIVFDGKIVPAGQVSIFDRIWVPVKNGFRKVETLFKDLLAKALSVIGKFLVSLRGVSGERNKVAAHTTVVVQKSRKPPHYSLNTNYVDLDVLSFNQGTKVYTSAYPDFMAWNNGTLPTPSDPGELADAATKSKISGTDSDYWTTGVSVAEGAYNYQMYKFTVSERVYSIRRIAMYWKGYGEPTPGHNTDLELWNNRTSSWELLDSALIGSPDGFLTGYKEDQSRSNCLACHDGAPPAGVNTTGLLNIAAYYNAAGAWNRSMAADPHGVSTSTGWGGDLKAPFKRGNPALSCEECHDTHGSSNAYHLRESVNGKTGITGINTDGLNAVKFCTACHASNYHQGCMNCHGSLVPGATGDHLPGGYSAPDNPAATKCFNCHKHSGVIHSPSAWVELPQPGCDHCHNPYGTSGM